ELELFYLTREPGLALNTFNRGIAGDTTAGALKRIDWDVLPARPTVVTILLGMNDVGRDLYDPGRTGPEVETLRAARVAAYAANLRTLVERLRASGARIVLLGPTPYDDTARLKTPASVGCNAALADLAAAARELARESGSAWIDLHTPLTALNLQRQATDPAYTLVGPDRVHPGWAGHLAVAYYLLRAQSAPALVSSVALDAAAAKVLAAERARVSGLVVATGSIAFEVEELSLPYPLDPALASAARDLVPFASEFNQQLLRVDGLVDGHWRLAIDGETIGEFSAAQLASGVDLASLPSTPQLRQARLVREALAEKWEAESRLRTLAYARHGAWPDAPRPFDPAQMQARVDARRASVGRTNAWIDAQLALHAELQPREDELAAHVASAAERASALARPQPHRYKLTLVPQGVSGK
nr:GDSL-type esterase/lipase family protein [Opitutaceae bacterium]